jgi:putative endonuclease
MTGDRISRRSREAAGRRAETICAWFLRLKGYRIAARRFRAPVGEIDIIATRRGTIAFIEVKARKTVSKGLEAVSWRQRRRIERASMAFLQRQPALAAMEMRFDLVVVLPRGWPVHVMDAWRCELGGVSWAE